MKKALLTLAFVATATSAFAADGTITFYNRNYTSANGENFLGTTATTGGIMLLDGTGAGKLGAGFITVGLFLASNLNTPLATTTLRTAANVEGVFQTANTINVAAVQPRQTGNFVIRAWETADGSFTASTTANHYRGEQAFTSLPLGGPIAGSPDDTAPGLTGFTGFVLVPEPSTYALGIAGLGALVMMRRRK